MRMPWSRASRAASTAGTLPEVSTPSDSSTITREGASLAASRLVASPIPSEIAVPRPEMPICA